MCLDLRSWLSVSDRETPVFTMVNGTATLPRPAARGTFQLAGDTASAALWRGGRFTEATGRSLIWLARHRESTAGRPGMPGGLHNGWRMGYAGVSPSRLGPRATFAQVERDIRSGKPC